ncbi:MAG: FtsK/SpoIIIE domain-containing protein [Coriobacteriales bacterium]|nr:FtsK/SpoIIIE domain-containing protein [Coriobacteriales bacterium]
MSVFLFTLLGDAMAQTFSLNGRVQSSLRLTTDDAKAEQRELVLARLEKEGLVLEPVEGARFVLPGRKDAVERPLFLSRDQTALVGVVPAGESTRRLLYVRPATRGMARFELMSFAEDVSLELGHERGCSLWYQSAFIAAHHARLNLARRSWTLECLSGSVAVVVNGEVLSSGHARQLQVGDVVQLLDLTLLVGTCSLYANQPEALRWQLPDSARRGSRAHELMSVLAASDVRECDAFYPSPRLSKSLPPCALEVEAPAPAWQQDEQPVLMRMGPSFLMGMSAALMAANSVSGLAKGGELMQTLPSLSMAVAMLCGSVVWPLASHAYERREAQRKELQRCRSYVGYLDRVEDKLTQAAALQAAVLEERLCTLPELLSAAHDRLPLVMSHVPEREETLELRVGTGDRELAADVSWPRPSLSSEGDELWERLEQLAQNPPRLRDVPLSCDLMRHRALGVLGTRALGWEFVRGLMVQLATLYSYRELKLVLVAQERERAEWTFATNLGHLMDEAERSRLLALTPEGMARVERVLEAARLKETQGGRIPGEPRYVVVCANEALTRQSSVLKRLAIAKGYEGFSCVYLAERLRDLPRECSYLIDLAPEATCMFERADVEATSVSFTPDMLVTREQAHAFALDLARVRLDARDELSAAPESLGFLELMETGSVEQLNVGKRWAGHDGVKTLAAPVGRGACDAYVSVDLHESAQGPHALVAGTTGSGKSELIISYVLSLCVHYAPDVVSLLLIDYKGGGLAGAFCNERRRLPHVAGTITNLDGNVIWRSLTSLRSELTRRQRVLNQARDVTGEATMDIGRYLSLYHHGVLKEPLPHLVVIADEFAELKQQEPAFMEELMSAARIGRSLGVHLVLATQKPTGVINDQIWSNARLKLSLKVSDTADSREMLRRDDAAHLTRPGEFCLLVGYDESFCTAQAAYCGGPYVPREHFERKRDQSVELLDAEGETVVALGPAPASRVDGLSELNAVLDEIERVAEASGKHATPLWLDPLPERLGLVQLIARYGLPEEDALVCVVGELDDPAHQQKMRLDANLEELGNVLVCGAAGLGGEELLCAMGASLACRATSELWLYAADYGGGDLAPLAALPSCGGVVHAGEDERWECLLHLAERELASRKERRAHAQGSRPEMVLLLSNLPALLEACQEGEERLVALMRDAPHYGMHVLACADGVHELHLRLRACFGLLLPVALPDASDYLAVLGDLDGAVVPRQRLRGLYRLEGRVLAFQGADLAGEGEDAREALAGLCDLAGTRRTPEIPHMPRRIQAKDMGRNAREVALPVGYDARDIEPLFVSFCACACQLVLGNDHQQLVSFVRGMCETLALDERVRLSCLEAGELAGEALQAHVEELLEYRDERMQLTVLIDGDQIMQQLTPACTDRLGEALMRPVEEGGHAWVVVAEAWRVAALYESWWRNLSSRGAGIWVGDGLSDQTVLRLARLPRSRVPAQEGLFGYVVEHGQARGVRLVEGSVNDGEEMREDAREEMA